jgi:carbon monoxide dehydrogenase subunit G
MKLSSSFWVPAASERVFAHFLDPDSMQACVPGCQELVKVDDTHYRGRLVNDVAHVRFSAGFTAEITELARPGQVRATLRGEDRRLGSTIKIEAALSVREDGEADRSCVEFGLDVALWGKIGRLGESIVRRRTEEVERQFAETFSRVCDAGPPGPENTVVRELLADAPVLAQKATQKATQKAPTPVQATAGQATGPQAAATRRMPWWRRLVTLLTGRIAAARR